MIRIQNYVMAESLEQAYQLNQNKRSRIIGGMLWLKMSNIAVHTAIDLSRLELNEIEETEEEFSIGAMTTLRQLELHEGLNAYANGAVPRRFMTSWASSSAIWPPWAAACSAASVSPMC